MPTYQIITETMFTASHALRLPDGGYEPTHGHDWPVAVTVQSEKLDAMACVMDFHELEKIVDAVLEPWHGHHLNDVAPFANEAVNPSAERVAEQIALAVAGQLPKGVTLVEACVGEAEGCTAVYRV
jgi:6-pyruvoyltetrahydropterin/6-carboxytetrahydropterin synthase